MERARPGRGPALLADLHAGLESRLAGRHWVPKVVIASLALACLFSVPGFEQGGRRAERAWRIKWAPIVALKVQDPLLDMGRLFDEASNEAKRTFRVAVPALAWATGTGVRGAFVFNGLCAYLVLHAAAVLAFALLASRAQAAYVTLLLASGYFGTAALKDYFGWFDSTAFAALLLAVLARRPGWRAAALLFAFLTDERAILVAPALLLTSAAAPAAGLGSWRSAAAAGAAALLGYLAFRVGLSYAHGIRQATAGIDLANVRLHLPSLALGLWAAFEAGWLVLAWGFARLWRSGGRERRLAAAAGAYFAAYLLSCLAVHDETRSMAYAAVFLFPLLGALAARVPRAALADRLLAAAAVSAVVPNVFVWKTLEYETNLLFWWLGW